MKFNVPRPVSGYVVYSQVAADLRTKYELAIDQETALNTKMAKAIRGGDLRSYDVHTDLPCDLPDHSVYVRASDIEAWLHAVGYPYAWEGAGSTASAKAQPGKGTGKRWTDELIESLMTRRQQLRAQPGCKNWAEKAAGEFGIDSSRARLLIKEYRERKEKQRNVSSWKQSA
jgi:hypothetical protein